MLAFAAGDFAFNLYWQSLSLYLLFYYTDSVGLTAAAAGLIYMVASIWDGLVDPVIGVMANRTQTRWGRYRPYLLLGALPLGLAFMLLYWRPPLAGTALIAVVLGGHLLFRSLYALVSVPYAALTARITLDARERGNISGLRMLFATLAAMTVALTTQPIAIAVTGRSNGALGFFVAAAAFGAIATAVILFVFATTREQQAEAGAAPPIGLWPALSSVARNRAFWTLVIGGGFMICCATALGKSVLYYFKYALHDEAGARGALALSSASGLVAAPLWMLAARAWSKRAVWLGACAMYAAGLIVFALVPIRSAQLTTAFLIYMQAGYVGMAFAYWGLLPDTVEWGQWRTGVRAEAVVFGLALLFQKVSLGLGAGLFGTALSVVGYHANQAQTAETLRGMKAVMVGLPLAGVALCALVMVFNPLRRGVHERIVAEILGRP
jgi:GPH family glycoside/pentoside/hexuronide:cation symporter